MQLAAAVPRRPQRRSATDADRTRSNCPRVVTRRAGRGRSTRAAASNAASGSAAAKGSPSGPERRSPARRVDPTTSASGTRASRSDARPARPAGLGRRPGAKRSPTTRSGPAPSCTWATCRGRPRPAAVQPEQVHAAVGQHAHRPLVVRAPRRPRQGCGSAFPVHADAEALAVVGETLPDAGGVDADALRFVDHRAVSVAGVGRQVVAMGRSHCVVERLVGQCVRRRRRRRARRT